MLYPVPTIIVTPKFYTNTIYPVLAFFPLLSRCLVKKKTLEHSKKKNEEEKMMIELIDC